jgi:hypothetical protein
VKYAKIAGVVTWSGGKTVLNGLATTADDDHPLVKERPDLWTDEGPTPRLSTPAGDRARAEQPKVERATNPPGIKRGRPQQP